MRKQERYLVMKRVFDLGCSIVGMTIMIVVALLLLPAYAFGENKGPLFFKQNRNGQGGKKIGVYKFRSMICNAEEKLRDNPELYQKYVANSYKLEPEEDPRITRLGRFIRKSSVDELPQFINVFKGEMSMIGPRPVLDEELEEYGDKKADFLSMKPGITGVWQASGRSEVPYPERCGLELSYLSNQSIAYDFKLIIETIKSVLVGKGAY